ncbi:AAA domain protein [Clostridium liquoris]|jgi:MoxR-like ATPase|uniref:AAA domain protein n=1 Tax=Clostridium liquoris TaxID=1289519 RepID=A0A2T0B526_9CLOT|nr:AAA family ATPase [Clostridium liquoris]PRR78913.1 AAA domain protein [Clostridium liquoris]
MNFNDALLTVSLVIKSGAVPLIIGESGIGKTSLVRKLGENEGYYVVNIDGNLLKEGEIGGLPTVEEYTTNLNGIFTNKKRTVYAVHTKLLEIEKSIDENPNRRVLLFIDEINRCEHSVQQELMNIILNREINGYVLPSQVDVIAAMNPSNKYDAFEQSDYQVVDMDPAQEDRFVWIELDADVKAWLQWATDEKINIHQDIVQFIATFPEYLHTPYSQESIKATPRSWERISKAYKVYLNEKDNFPSRIFYNVVKGNVGGSIAQDFFNFLQENKHPLITSEELFNREDIDKALIERVKEESHSRLYLASKNALLYLKDKENRTKEIDLFSKFLQLYPADLRMGIMQEIKFNYGDNLYKEFMMNETFVNGYFSMYEQIED